MTDTCHSCGVPLYRRIFCISCIERDEAERAEQYRREQWHWAAIELERRRQQKRVAS